MTRSYLEARVRTASQPELHTMLLEGALRFARLAQQSWDAPGQGVEALENLRKALEIVEELVRSVAGGEAPAAKRLEEEYAFAFRQLASALLNRDSAPLQQGLQLLEYHRETWRQACSKLKPSGPPAPNLDFGAAATAGLSLQA